LKRIIGLDVARAFAIIGMIIVNFKLVLGNQGSYLGNFIFDFFDGKASAIFVVLAGTGIAIMFKASSKSNNLTKINLLKKRILKRALFLLITGLILMIFWIGDILHFYAVYMIFMLFLIDKKSIYILLSGITIVMFYPLLLFFLDYGTSWDFEKLEYYDIWTVNGFVRNLFFNGFHPVFPWISFMFFGFLFGNQNLDDFKIIKKIFWISLITFIFVQLFSYYSISFFSNELKISNEELFYIIGTGSMPPLPIYMLNGTSVAFVIITGSIILSKKFSNYLIIDLLHKTGKLSLTIYVLHIFLGIGIIEFIYPKSIGYFSLNFSIACALIYSLFSILSSYFWLKYFNKGPLEWVMRKLTD
tara:strand:+ start:6002 stop:7075 length:1074 start_codon:yes stop_codon:yes gene_type:complete